MSSLIIGASEAANRLKKLISMVAPSDASVIIQGETGVGKELVAESLHQVSRRKGKFIAVNCAAIPRELMEAELFGYEKGAFTGAVKTTPGKFEQANHGTLFLDEIGDMNLELQSKLLRVLENSKVTKVGGRSEVQLNVRIICATHKNLEKLVEQNKFREDLLFRLNVFPIKVPTLAERADDIPMISEHLLQRKSKLQNISFSQDGYKALTSHTWPGNIRELKNLLERASVFFPNQKINHDKALSLLPGANQTSLLDSLEESDAVWNALDNLGGGQNFRENAQQSAPEPANFARLFNENNSVNLRQLLQEIEIVMIQAALERNSKNMSESAKDLHLQRTTLIEKVKKYGL